MRACARCIKDDTDLFELGHGNKPVDPFMGRCHPHALGAGQAIGRRVDADHHAHLERLRQAHNLDHQVGPDIAGPDDRYFGLGHDQPLLKVKEQRPMPPTSATT